MAKTIPPELPVTTLAELQTRPEYLACSEKMRRWLTVLIESGFDYTAATEAAFSCKTRRHAQVFSFAVRRWARIRTCLNLYLGISARDAQLEDARLERKQLLRKVRRNLRHAEPGSVAAQRLLAQEERLIFGGEPEADDVITPPVASEAAPVRFRVGDIAIRADKTKLRVTAVDDQGRVTEGDPVP